ncbi:MAG: class sortase [Amycolatopsis sp.]|uniref:class F sortase n=1 Tax=Amycolatopsis sp. TaxID=37632 RepID=UPI00261C955A|nr:class F sortase [Amycolatopsis sp.]MCU1680866.1 class sortase [Amycolatopsis sp.]
MTSQARRGRHLFLGAFFLGVASLLVVELVAVGVSRWSPSTTVAGVAHPVSAAAAAVAEPARAPAPAAVPTPTSTRSPPPAAAVIPAPPPGPQPRGSIRLPDGGTATLVRKELGPDGALPVPDDLGQAAEWGAVLGAANGASVFAGHVNWGGATGPFAELWSARIDAPVTIVDAGGKTWTYHVTQLFTVRKDDLPRRADELFGQQGAHRVVLVTCGGEWIGGVTGYDENRVVIAEQVP